MSCFALPLRADLLDCDTFGCVGGGEPTGRVGFRAARHVESLRSEDVKQAATLRAVRDSPAARSWPAEIQKTTITFILIVGWLKKSSKMPTKRRLTWKIRVRTPTISGGAGRVALE